MYETFSGSRNQNSYHWIFEIFTISSSRFFSTLKNPLPGEDTVYEVHRVTWIRKTPGYRDYNIIILYYKLKRERSTKDFFPRILKINWISKWPRTTILEDKNFKIAFLTPSQDIDKILFRTSDNGGHVVEFKFSIHRRISGPTGSCRFFASFRWTEICLTWKLFSLQPTPQIFQRVCVNIST